MNLPPKGRVAHYVAEEGRFAMLGRAHPEQAAHLVQLLQDDVDARWDLYEQMAGINRAAPGRA